MVVVVGLLVIELIVIASVSKSLPSTSLKLQLYFVLIRIIEHAVTPLSVAMSMQIVNSIH